METYALKKETLYQSLRREILSGKYAPESRLPKELDFCRQLGVAKVTLRSALEKLEADGLVARIPGKGTFISARHKSNLILVCIVKKSGIDILYDEVLAENAKRFSHCCGRLLKPSAKLQRRK